MRWFIVFAACFGLLVSATVFGDQPGQLEQGQEMYARYCSACHGKDGTGNGALRDVLRVPPADLTKIAARGKGTFEASRVAKFIDGREDVKAHGPRSMPVWGQHFAIEGDPHTEDLEGPAQVKVNALLVYLRSIQRR